MRKFKLMPFVLLGSVFGLSACTLPSWLSWLSFIPGLEAPKEEKKEEKKEEEDDDDEDKDKKQEYKISFSEMLSKYAAMGVANVVIPDYVSANSEVTGERPYPDDYPNFYLIQSTTEEEFEDYLESLVAGGWTFDEYDEEELAYSYIYNLSGLAEGQITAEISVANWLDSTWEGVAVQFFVYIAPYSQFPTSAVNADLASLGFSDTLPAFSGQGSSFSYYSAAMGGPQVVIAVGEGNEAEAVSTYQSDLTGASYTEYGADSYGDMQYLSPNGEFLVCPWTYTDEDADGNIYISVLEVPAAEFPLSDVNAYLSENEYGFTLSAANGEALTALSDSFDKYIGEYGGYPICQITIGGEVADEVAAIVGPLATGAGYTDTSDEEGYSYVNYTTYCSVYVSVSNGYTLLTFY